MDDLVTGWPIHDGSQSCTSVKFLGEQAKVFSVSLVITIKQRSGEKIAKEACWWI